MSEPMIQLNGLRFAWTSGDFRLHVPNLKIARGTSVAITGSSGAGKTTLLHLIAGILSPAAGTVTIDGTTTSHLPDSARRAFRLRHIGLVFQSFELIDYLNVIDNVLLPSRINHVLPLTAGRRERAASLLDQVGLARFARRSVVRLSQGERQRVAICRALLPGPSLLLADEPTGNLDPDSSRRILDILLQQVRDHDATLVMVSHDHSLLNAFDSTIDFSQFTSTMAVESQDSDGGVVRAD